MSDLLPVGFVYLGPDGKEHHDAEFQALCPHLPRVGDFVEGQAGSTKVVTGIYHRVVTDHYSSGEQFNIMATTVVLKDVPE